MKRWYIAAAILVSVIIVSGGTYLTYSRDMQTIRDRLSTGSQVIQTQHGSIEYTDWGDGPAVLVVHGAEFMPLTTGGHLLLGHHAEVRARVNAFLRQYAGTAK